MNGHRQTGPTGPFRARSGRDQPKAEHEAEWQAAMRALLLVAEHDDPAMFARIGPGMFKSFVTLRTGNAWVHALGYHAVTPHVVVGTPLIVKALGIR